MRIRQRYAWFALSSALLIAFMGPVLSGLAAAFTSMPVTGFPSFQRNAETPLGAGKFLVAGRNIRDPLFSQAVILLIDYGPQGAMGIVVNHTSGVKLPDVLPNLKGAKQRTDTVYIGGPVGINQIFMLIRSAGEPGESLHVFGRVYVSTSESVLERMIAKPMKGERFRLYAGYSGWGAGQLEKEVSRGDWHVVDADEHSIFDKKPSAVWPDLIEKASGQWVSARDRQPHYL